MPSKDPAEYLPTGVQKSYFMLSPDERAILNTALEKYQSGQSAPILVGGRQLLKPALKLMSAYRLQIDEITDDKAITSYTRWVEAVQVVGANQDVYLTFSPHFKRIWLQVKKRMPDYVAQELANIGLRSKYALRLYSWAKKYVEAGGKRITVDEIRKVMGLESVTDAAGNVIREAPLAAWANFRQRALDKATAEINKKTDLRIKLEGVERLSHRVHMLQFKMSGIRFFTLAAQTLQEVTFMELPLGADVLVAKLRADNRAIKRTGFSEKLLKSLSDELNKIAIKACPFYNLPATGRGLDPGLSAAEMKRCIWVRPMLVCQVKFTEWTRDDRLRQPVFLGIREDKSAGEIIR